MTRFGASLLLLAALAGCGSKNPAADQLDNAAEQSTPAAADVLHNEADRLRDQNATDAGAVQQGMQNAGNAQAAAVPATPAPQSTPSSVQAKPHRAGDPVPPPKTPAH